MVCLCILGGLCHSYLLQATLCGRHSECCSVTVRSHIWAGACHGLNCLVVKPPPLKNMTFINWDDEIPNWMEKTDSCSKPPTSKSSKHTILYQLVWDDLCNFAVSSLASLLDTLAIPCCSKGLWTLPVVLTMSHGQTNVKTCSILDDNWWYVYISSGPTALAHVAFLILGKTLVIDCRHDQQ